MAPIKSPPKNNTLISSFFKRFQRPAPGSDTPTSTQNVGENNAAAASASRLPQTAPTQSQSPSSTPAPAPSTPLAASPPSTSDSRATPTPRAQTQTLPVTSLPSPTSQDGQVTSTPLPEPFQEQPNGEREESRPSIANVDGFKSHHFAANPVESQAEQSSPNPADTMVDTNTSLPPPLPLGTPSSKPPTPSFSSISTLTSVPKSSQASALPLSSSTSSRRVVSDGLQGITGSDSESEDLEDFSTLYSKKRRKLSHDDDNITVAQRVPKKAAPAPKSTRLGEKEKKKNFFKAYPRSPVKAAPRNSLASLVADAANEQMADATIASIESAMEESRKRDEQKKALMENPMFDGAALIDAAGSDSEGRERMIIALARTEALHDKNHYHFFLDPEPSHVDSDFPIDSLPDEPWSKIYQNEQSRRHACVSGFAAELAAKYPLPMSITSWMACQLLYEASEELCEAYVEILRASGHHDQSISDTWGSLNSIYKTRSLFENNWSDHVKTALPSGLVHMVRLVSFRAPAIDSIVSEAQPHSTCAAFLDLALMNVDELVKDDLSISMAIATCIEEMLEALSEDSYSQLIPLTVATMFSPSSLPEYARCKAIEALPASTPRAHRLRRRLALEYFSTAEKKATDNRDWAKSIVHTIKTKPTFRLSESTDYFLLKHLVHVLDIAVDAGWIDYSLFASREPRGAWGERAPPTEAEHRHNAQIDAITDALMSVASRIRDAGTSHLRRSEAKGLMEQVVARLQFGVRSRIKHAQGVFDGGLQGDVLRQATFNAKSFGKKVEWRDQVEVVAFEQLSDREDDAEDGDKGA